MISSSPQRRKPRPPGDGTYDYFLLAQMWPQTSCYSLNRKWRHAEDSCSPCNMPRDDLKWTVHGLWPNSNSGRHPANCNNVQYNPQLLSQSFRQDMMQKWPTLKDGMTNDGFWSHEFKKHGTCALDHHLTNTIPKYFSMALELLDKYNLGPILSSQNIFPGRVYNLNQVQEAIQRELGVGVQIQCSRNPVSMVYNSKSFSIKTSLLEPLNSKLI